MAWGTPLLLTMPIRKQLHRGQKLYFDRIVTRLFFEINTEEQTLTVVSRCEPDSRSEGNTDRGQSKEEDM